MEWLLEFAERYRTQIRSGPFFQHLARAERPSDLTWIHQLLHQSREFTQALCMRYSLCRDKSYQSIFAEHAFEEADHPDQLLAWMAKHGFFDEIEPGSVPASQETVNNLAFCWRSAVREPHDVQVVTLNVLSEGVALDFYSATIPMLDRMGILSGRYWKVHREVDNEHLQLGLDRCGDVDPNSRTGMLYQRMLWHSACLYHQMLSSWVGESAEPLLMLRTESCSSRMPVTTVARSSSPVIQQS